MVTRQLQVGRRTGEVRRPKTDVLPLSQRHLVWSRKRATRPKTRSLLTARRPSDLPRESESGFTANLNSDSSIECAGLSVVVAVPARINGSGVVSQHSVVSGGSLTLDCPASGVPRPDIRWTHQGEAMSATAERHVVDGGRRLELYGAHLSDAGLYTCTAANTAGAADKRFIVSVISQSVIFLSDTSSSICCGPRFEFV